MDTAVPPERTPPSLAARFREPPGFQWGTFVTESGASLRWGHFPNPDADKTCVLVGGFAEFIEKYFETARDFAARNFDVWCLDWQGQGASDRWTENPTRPRAREYERDADTLAKFIEARTPAGKPRLLVAHSMGGAIALLCLSLTPGIVDAAVLSAPMLGLPLPPIVHLLARMYARMMTKLGFANHFIPGAGPWKARENLCAANSRASTDAERCLLQREWFTFDPQLRVDGPTFGWIDAAFALTTRLRNPAVLRRIMTPILLGSAQRELFVNPSAHRRAAKYLPHCQLVAFPGGKHELFHESDSVRGPWFEAIDAFSAAHLHPSPQSRKPHAD